MILTPASASGRLVLRPKQASAEIRHESNRIERGWIGSSGVRSHKSDIAPPPPPRLIPHSDPMLSALLPPTSTPTPPADCLWNRAFGQFSFSFKLKSQIQVEMWTSL
jgi:hypothetical protein